MSTKTKPTIVFCHGIWADGSCFSKVIPALQADGHEVIAVQYSLESFEEDVAMVKRTLNRVGSPVLLVGHSYGGATITASGVDDRVAGLVYIGAVAPDVGETVQDQLEQVSLGYLFSRRGRGRLRLDASERDRVLLRRPFRAGAETRLGDTFPAARRPLHAASYPAHPVGVEAKLVHFVPARPHRSPGSPTVGIQTYGSDCDRGRKQPRADAF